MSEATDLYNKYLRRNENPKIPHDKARKRLYIAALERSDKIGIQKVTSNEEKRVEVLTELVVAKAKKSRFT